MSEPSTKKTELTERVDPNGDDNALIDKMVRAEIKQRVLGHSYGGDGVRVEGFGNDPESLGRAANAFNLAYQVEQLVHDTLVRVVNVLTGSDNSPIKGPPAEALRTVVEPITDTVEGQLKSMRETPVGFLPDALMTGRNWDSWMVSSIVAISQQATEIAKELGSSSAAKADGGGTVFLVSEIPALAKATDEAMRKVAKDGNARLNEANQAFQPSLNGNAFTNRPPGAGPLDPNAVDDLLNGLLNPGFPNINGDPNGLGMAFKGPDGADTGLPPGLTALRGLGAPGAGDLAGLTGSGTPSIGMANPDLTNPGLGVPEPPGGMDVGSGPGAPGSTGAGPGPGEMPGIDVPPPPGATGGTGGAPPVPGIDVPAPPGGVGGPGSGTDPLGLEKFNPDTSLDGLGLAPPPGSVSSNVPGFGNIGGPGGVPGLGVPGSGGLGALPGFAPIGGSGPGALGRNGLSAPGAGGITGPNGIGTGPNGIGTGPNGVGAGPNGVGGVGGLNGQGGTGAGNTAAIRGGGPGGGMGSNGMMPMMPMGGGGAAGQQQQPPGTGTWLQEDPEKWRKGDDDALPDSDPAIGLVVR